MKYIVNKSTFLSPDLLESNQSGWFGHIPFAYWLMEVARPDVFVELGTHYGHSYFSFCKGVCFNKLKTTCYAVDTWAGDNHSGLYGEDIYRCVNVHNTEKYSSFSNLLRMTFDEALGKFNDASVDILHIDGFHTYEAVKHDFETWLPKLSKRGIILFHDIEVRERDFGVWQLWEELRKRYPSFEFSHSHGLGILLVGENCPDALRQIADEWQDEHLRYLITKLFSSLGNTLETEINLAEKIREITSLKQDIQELSLSKLKLSETQQELSNTRAQLQSMRRSSSWLITSPYRYLGHHLKKLLMAMPR